MKKLLPYLFMMLPLAGPVLAHNGHDIIGGDPVVLPDWEAKIYPNPNNGIFNIMVTGSTAPLNVAVFNVIGEKVFELRMLGEHGARIDLSSLEKGLYVVQIADPQRGEARTLRMQVK